MQHSTITMTVKDGQLEFDNLPEGWGVHVKNYDTNISEETYMTESEMEERSTFRDDNGWYHSSYFTDLSPERFVEDPQTELPLAGF